MEKDFSLLFVAELPFLKICLHKVVLAICQAASYASLVEKETRFHSALFCYCIESSVYVALFFTIPVSVNQVLNSFLFL